jgi:scaffold protein (connect acetoacetyl-CoA thiolase and HMG-CoA synthase)
MDLPRYHRLRSPYYRLEGQRCTSCGTIQFPARASCRSCHSRGLQPHQLSGRGTIFSYAQVAQPPHGFSGPYLVAMIQLEEGVRVTAQLTDLDPDEAAIGLPVEMVVRRLREYGPNGYLVYGYKFRPQIRPGANP